MRVAAFLLSLFPVLINSPSTLAQQTQQRDPQAIAVLAQSQAALSASAPSVRDAIAVGTITLADGTSGTITMKSMGNDHLRHDISMSDRLSSVVVNQGKGFSNQNGKKIKAPPWSTSYLRPEHIPAFSRLSDFLRPNMKVVYVGVENIAGNAAHHIRMAALPTDDNTPPEIEDMISEYHIFIDTQSLQVIKTITFAFSGDAIENRTAVETYYSDYRPVGGLLIPFRISAFEAGQKRFEIALTSVSLNVGLTDTDFQ